MFDCGFDYVLKIISCKKEKIPVACIKMTETTIEEIVMTASVTLVMDLVLLPIQLCGPSHTPLKTYTKDIELKEKTMQKII